MGYARTLPTSGFEFGSTLMQSLTVTNVNADYLFTVTVSMPDLNINVGTAYVDMYIPYAKNTGAGANTVANLGNIQVKRNVGGTYINAIAIPAATMLLDNGETFKGILRLTGTYDVSSIDVNNCTLYFKWKDAQMSLASVEFHNIWFIVRVSGE